MNPETEFTRKKLSKFICQELLYEFVTHSLDSLREQEVTNYLATCRESQREFDNLNKGLRYTEKARAVAISPKLIEALENFEPHWKKRLRAWTLWSSARGWRLLPYIVSALAVILGLVVMKPWVQKVDQDVLLAEQLKIEPEAEPARPKAASREAAPENAATPNIAAAPNVGAAPSTAAPNVGAPPTAPVTSPTPLPAAAPAVRPTESTPQKADETEAMGRGALYRAEMSVEDFNNSWPAIRDKIVALGGKAAGNVELGWLRKSTESYFHFSLPESNLNELEIFLATFSPVRFSKERHPRVMPEGQIRIIMSVKDGMTQNEAPAETP